MAPAAGLDDAALKVLQLECIITSKDKEISLLREQLSQDQEELIQQLQQEVDSLKRQLQQQQQQQQHPKQQDQTQQQQQHQQQSGHLHAQANSNSGSGSSRGAMGRGGVIELNVNSTLLTTTVAALQQVPGSRLATMFEPSHLKQLPHDSQGRVFLPYEAEAFKVLLSLLHATSVFGRASPAFSQLLASHSPPTHPYLLDLVQHLGLQQLLLPDAAPAARGQQTAPLKLGAGQHGAGAVHSSGCGRDAGSSGSPRAAAAAAAADRAGVSAPAAAAAAAAAAGHHPKASKGHQPHPAQHGTAHGKPHQQQQLDPEAAAAAAAGAAAAQSAAQMALAGRLPVNSGGGAAAAAGAAGHDTAAARGSSGGGGRAPAAAAAGHEAAAGRGSSGGGDGSSGAGAGLVAAVALKGLKQGHRQAKE